MINEIQLVSGANGVSHNSIYRGKDLGTINSLNEYIAFRQEHGIDDKSYKDLYLGDYFKIQDGTYNVAWMVAHFDYYWNKGPTGSPAPASSPRGVVLIPKTICGYSQMNDEAATDGGYKATIAHTVTCPAIASALERVLGSYLLNTYKSISTTTNSAIPSMAGANWVGCSTEFEFVLDRCSVPNETQIYGFTALSSSFYDIGEAWEKLAIFNYINPTEYGRNGFWLRNVVSSRYFSVAGFTGAVNFNSATQNNAMRPLIYIG